MISSMPSDARNAAEPRRSLSTSTALITASSPMLQNRPDLALEVSAGSGTVAAAKQDVGLDADRSQLAHRMLSRFGLQLARRWRCTERASGE